jgi:predicted outer membrane repeat protein
MSGNITKVLNEPVITDFSKEPTSNRERLPGSLLVVARSGDLNFQANSSIVGGAIFVEGAVDKIAGGPTQARS